MHPHRLHMDHRRCSSWPEPCPLERPRGPKTLVPVRWHPQLRRRISPGPSNLQFDLQQTPSKRRLSNHTWGCAANTTGNGVRRASAHCPQAQHSRPSVDLHLPTSTSLCESEYLADRKIWHLRLWGHREHPESSSNAGWHLRYILYKLLSHLLLPRTHGHFLVRPCKRKQKRGTEELSLIVYMCIYWVLIKIPLSGNGHSSRIKNYFRETFANSMFIFRGAHVGQQHLLWRFVHRLPNYARESRITSWYFWIAF